jgi:hypothetical protein
MPPNRGFANRDEFFEVGAELGNVSGDGSDFHYCPQRADEPLGPENIKLVEICHELDWDRVLRPAI